MDARRLVQFTEALLDKSGPHGLAVYSGGIFGDAMVTCSCALVFRSSNGLQEVADAWFEHRQVRMAPTSTIPKTPSIEILQRFLGFEGDAVDGIWGPKTDDAVCGLKGCTRRCIELIAALDKPVAEKVAAKLNPEDIRGGLSDGFLDVLLTTGNPMDKVMAAEILRLRKRIDVPRSLTPELARVGWRAFSHALGICEREGRPIRPMQHAWAAVLAELSGQSFEVDGEVYDPSNPPPLAVDAKLAEAAEASKRTAEARERHDSAFLAERGASPAPDAPDPVQLAGREEWMLATRAGTTMSYLSITPQGSILRTLNRDKARLFANKEVAQSFADALAFVLTDPSYTPVPARA